MSSAETDEAGQALVGTVLAGRYRIEALLGSGGMGSVYRAEHVHMRKAVAVKVLHREMTLFPEIVARFEREAVAAARIEHPHVAAATDFGRLEDGSFYLALELIEGRSLSALIKEQGPLPEERALGIARQIADALSAAHAARIIHRDLKPDNVMLLEREDGADFAKVLDFGIAKLKGDVPGESQQQLTQLGSIFGTPDYMSPEQARGIEVDARADLYTLGIILYEMLSGASPFQHEELVVVLTRQITQDPAPLPERVSTSTRELVLKLLRKDPAERVQSAAEVRERIDALLEAGLAVTAVEPLASTLKHQTPSTKSAGAEALARPALAGSAGGVVIARAAPVVATPGERAAHASTALDLPELARRPVQIAGALIQRWGLGRKLPVLGYAVPLGALVALGSVLLLVVVLTGTLLALSSERGAASAKSSPEALADPDVLALVVKAELGDRGALVELAKRPAAERSAAEWRGLAHGSCLNADFAGCLAVYSQGLPLEPELARDVIVLADIRALAVRAGLEFQALDLAARALGSPGADLLYDVWEAGKAAGTAPAKRARALLDEEPAKGHWSPGLQAVFKLQTAMKRPKCTELRGLLREFVAQLDARASAGLARLSDRRGCGFLGLSDCFSCLRTGQELSNALQAARGRPAPSFAALGSSPAMKGSGAVPSARQR